MTRAFVSRHRADEFDALVSSPAREHDTASSYGDLLELVGSLRSMPEVSARPDFVSDLRSQLIVEAARQARPVVDAELRLRLTPRQRSGARERRAATILGGFAIVAATGSMAVASQSALPDDVLYPVKRAIENAQTNLQSDDAGKAQTLIAHAERRLEEAERLTTEGASATTVAATLHDFTEQANQATELALDDYAATGDQATLGELRSFADESMDDLGRLGDAVPEEARGALITAAQSVQQADSAAFQVCPTCGAGGITDLPEFASEPVALDTGLFDYTAQPISIALPPGFLEKVEDEAASQEQRPPKQRHNNEGRGEEPGPPVTVPPSEPTIDPGNTPLQNIGDKIKDGLRGDPIDATVTTVNTVVAGLVGIVDGLLGVK